MPAGVLVIVPAVPGVTVNTYEVTEELLEDALDSDDELDERALLELLEVATELLLLDERALLELLEVITELLLLDERALLELLELTTELLLDAATELLLLDTATELLLLDAAIELLLSDAATELLLPGKVTLPPAQPPRKILTPAIANIVMRGNDIF
jgi:hypothetical protein